MYLEPSQRSAVVIAWPMSLEVLFRIDPSAIAEDTTVGLVAVRLVHLGGTFVDWDYQSPRRPAFARFSFPNMIARNQFVDEALKVPGVSIPAIEH